MKKLFFIKGVNAFINPMMVTSIYRAADSAHVVMSNGSDYTLSEEEYASLINGYEPKDDLAEKIAEAVKAALREDKKE